MEIDAAIRDAEFGRQLRLEYRKTFGLQSCTRQDFFFTIDHLLSVSHSPGSSLQTTGWRCVMERLPPLAGHKSILGWKIP